jgi:hypothetical protein
MRLALQVFSLAQPMISCHTMGRFAYPSNGMNNESMVT